MNKYTGEEVGGRGEEHVEMLKVILYDATCICHYKPIPSSINDPQGGLQVFILQVSVSGCGHC